MAANESAAKTATPESVKNEPAASEPAKAAPKKPRRWKRRLGIAAASLPVLLLAGWLAVHHIPGFGPWVADTLRWMFGNEFVAWLEDTAYGVEDWVNQKTRSDEPPEAFWEVPDARPTTAPPASAAPDAPPPFRLDNVGAMHENITTKGDGVWLQLDDPREPGVPTGLLKTFVHPDAYRSWAIVAIVAVDLSRVELHAVAGKYEPESKTKEAKSYERKALIPKEHHGRLLAAFNGGYKSTHGDYGMKIDGVVLMPPRPLSCAIAGYKDGRIAIRPWEKISDTETDMNWYRQTPVCLYDEGKPHPGLAMSNLGWGASAVSGTTVIRRSAIGIDPQGKVLYVAIGDHVTAKAMAEALNHAGAQHVAQLDVNFSFPKFFTYDWASPAKDKLKAIPLTGNFEFVEDEYIGTRAQRDFFYLTRREKS
jgi:hypothetical protein